MPVEYVEAVQDHIGAMQARAVSGDVDEGSGTCANRGVAQELRDAALQLAECVSLLDSVLVALDVRNTAIAYIRVTCWSRLKQQSANQRLGSGAVMSLELWG